MGLSVKQAAEYLEISETSVRTLYKQKRIKHRRVGTGRGVVRFEQEWLDEYLASTVVDVAGPKPRPKRSQTPSIKPSLRVRTLEDMERELA